MFPVLFSLWAAPVQAAPVQYQLDAADSVLAVTIYFERDRWSPITAHDHVIQATSFTGTVTWDPEDAGACAVEISFPVTSLVVDPSGARERAKIDPEGTLSDGNKETLLSNMKGKKTLNASTFPTISYRAESCSGTTGAVEVDGVLTVAGTGKSVTVPMQVVVTPQTFSAKGGFDLSHADFGMIPFTYGMGTPKNQERLPQRS